MNTIVPLLQEENKELELLLKKISPHFDVLVLLLYPGEYRDKVWELNIEIKTLIKSFNQ